MALFSKTKDRRTKAAADKRKGKDKALVTPVDAKVKAAASGMRGIGSGIVGTLLANQVRASAGKAGIAGVAAGLAFNVLLKRNPMGAMLFGGAILAHRAYRSGKTAQAKRAEKVASIPDSQTPQAAPKPVRKRAAKPVAPHPVTA